ncbi:MAG: isoleucine--tRNA ligase [Desulfobacteraceae bacterium 4572_130]|nr:MAG: isoleucine--tRNA ligase [Desulfobacteraceae bacterium 4572_130]
MDYKKTLNLPLTKFSMKANLTKNEPERLKEWDKSELYKKLRASSKKKKPFILHDGPPYANGHLHIGHAINKILKDIIIRSKQMAGFNAPYVPGWDCHGLPIEHNVDKKLGSRKKNMTFIEQRQTCRNYALKFVDIQRNEFKRFGILGEWNNPYLTMASSYEARIAKECGKFALNGNMFLGEKPIYWCYNCKTALAEAEIEYKDQSSPSIFVKFPVKDDLSDILPVLKEKKVFFVIWTTTPWTIPANLGVCLHPDFKYCAVQTKNHGILILAKELVNEVMKNFEIKDFSIIGVFDALKLENKKCFHPIYNKESLVILGNHVTLETGTGCVHTAPGHGADDYIVGLKYNLKPYSPVKGNGCFTEDVEFFNGQFILKANKEIIEKIDSLGLLLKNKEIVHSYPHCWRCKKPVIFRATPQWFISMDKNELREKSLKEIDNVQWIPEWGKARIYSMIENRPDWCISRQRSWGVPIPIFYCKDCGKVYITKESINKIYNLFKEHTSDIWFDKNEEELLPENVFCENCGCKKFEKDKNILDVWFDSGVSHAAVLGERENLNIPADLYLEGSDQHRGWFHSSLLTSVGATGKAPYKSVLTHGFVVDSKGKKMSKSVGNVVSPKKIIKRHGADILRLWVASADYKDDIKISDNIIKQLSDAYRRIRNTCRFMLGNLSGFDFLQDMQKIEHMAEIDRFILHKLFVLLKKVLKAYDKYEFHTIYHALYNFCIIDLSSFYLDIIKDRLYILPVSDNSRKDAQTVMYILLDSITKIMAPILPFTAEEIWEHMPEFKEKQKSIHMTLLPTPDKFWENNELAAKWEQIINIRSEVTKALEEARTAKIIGHPLDAELIFSISNNDYKDILKGFNDDLKDIFIVSSAYLTDEINEKSYKSNDIDGVEILVKRAKGKKCERCWKYDVSVGDNEKYADVCLRCVEILEKIL